MKLIGIIGKSGSGKTTLSRMLQRDENTAVIHLDEVTNMKSIMKKMPKAMTQNYTNNIGEEFILPSVKIRKIINILRKNPILNRAYLRTLRIPQGININKQVERYKKEGKKCVIVEGCELGALPIYKQLDYIIRIDAPFIEREKRVYNRDILLQKGIMVRRDKAFRDSIKKNRKQINRKIQNNGSIEELRKLSDEIYFEIIDNDIKKTKEETIRERYGGYKIKPIDMSKIESKSNQIEENKNK